MVRRAVLVPAGVMLLGYLYVCSYFALVWASHSGGPEWYLASVYKPLNTYNRSDLMGSREFRAIKYWMMNPNQGFMEAFEYQMNREAERLIAKQKQSQPAGDVTPPVTPSATPSD
jgi:hypothetical protein